MGFQFVERIVEIEPGRSARGRFTVPRSAPFPACLVAEAVGQLAAWAAMAKVDFARRPVAALAAVGRFHGGHMPGGVLDVDVTLDTCDDAATTYRGAAYEHGTPVLELERCLGPMLPMEEYDDRETVRRRFEELRRDGVAIACDEDYAARTTSERFDDAPGSRRARLDVPLSAGFFADHFPRRPVFPGTLLLDAGLTVARELAAEVFEALPAPSMLVRDLKFRRFLSPGDRVELAAVLKTREDRRARIALVATRGLERVATAQVEMQACP